MWALLSASDQMPEETEEEEEKEEGEEKEGDKEEWGEKEEKDYMFQKMLRKS